MQYYNPDNKAPRQFATIAVLVYFAELLLLMVLVRFSVLEPNPLTEGILVEFGETDFGVGSKELAETDVASTPPPPQPQAAEEHLETDDREDISLEQQKVEDAEQQKKPQEEQPVKQRDTVVVEERVVNKQALFPGRDAQSKTASQGVTENQGNQGAQSGGESGAMVGGGDGNDPVVVLKDRSIVGVLPKPDYDASATGRVIMDITVDENGNVMTASYRSLGSTTNNTQLIEAAHEAARKSRFSPSDNFVQGGTITYTFRMN
ncbi:MAG: TonB family protein [Rikenellaceae bacterium]